MKATVTREIAVDRSPRVMQCEALFDVPPTDHAIQQWDVDMPIEEQDWHVGLIVGPSGAGKSSIAHECFADTLAAPHDWSPDRAIVDEFPTDLDITEITQLLSSTGLGSIPTWTRPYRTLSTGEQFRADVAYGLATMRDRCVIDEWTSTVDRTVAKVASAAAARAVRTRAQQLVALTCHYDVIEWLQPDWIYEPHSGDFTWRSVQPRPQVKVEIYPVDRAAWRVFKRHHYLTAQLPPGQYFGGFVDGECIAFAGVTHYVHRSPKVRNMRRIARTVTLPDWQGIGLGGGFVDAVANVVANDGYRVRLLMAHPGLIRHCLASPRWCDVSRPTSFVTGSHADASMARGVQQLRRLAVRTFEYALPL